MHMKKRHRCLLLSLLTLLTSQGIAQFSSGDMFITGHVTAVHQDGTVGSTTDLVLQPQVGIFISQRTALGLLLQYNFSSTTRRNTVRGSAGFFGRTYIPITDNFLFLLQASSAWGGSIEQLTTASRDHIFSSVGGMFAFFPTPRWAFETRIIHLSHEHSWISGSGHSGRHDLVFNAGSLNLAATWFLRRTAARAPAETP
jgi:hypothetical protein